MKDSQVQRKHRENERGKGNPPERLRCHRRKSLAIVDHAQARLTAKDLSNGASWGGRPDNVRRSAIPATADFFAPHFNLAADSVADFPHAGHSFVVSSTQSRGIRKAPVHPFGDAGENRAAL